ncbi:Protein of unknown function [Cotesia congregata]|uniref:Uncharacterized protein n=1 Tax=Cotesia congregata TaxID=51543 RepID=A0A8J2HBJ5_COTCN|nr:Protein of unknown function [Cotesia congregata]
MFAVAAFTTSVNALLSSVFRAISRREIGALSAFFAFLAQVYVRTLGQESGQILGTDCPKSAASLDKETSIPLLLGEVIYTSALGALHKATHLARRLLEDFSMRIANEKKWPSQNRSTIFKEMSQKLTEYKRDHNKKILSQE